MQRLLVLLFTILCTIAMAVPMEKRFAMGGSAFGGLDRMPMPLMDQSNNRYEKRAYNPYRSFANYARQLEMMQRQ